MVNFSPRPLHPREKKHGPHPLRVGGWVGHSSLNIQKRNIFYSCRVSPLSSPKIYFSKINSSYMTIKLDISEHCNMNMYGECSILHEFLISIPNRGVRSISRSSRFITVKRDTPHRIFGRPASNLASYVKIVTGDGLL